MAGNARFHNKFHRRNHHSIPSTGYPDSGTDPIASQDEPFLGDFYLGGSLSANGSAKIDGNLLVVGNLSALGEFSYIDTVVSVTSALSVVNTGTGPALTVWQYGDQPIARFIDKNDSCSLLLEDDGRISMNTCNLEPGIGLSINLNISATRSLTANASPGIYHYLVGSVAEGHAYAVGLDSHAEGVSSRSLGNFSHAEGLSALTLTQATASHAEGQQTITLGVASHAEGQNTRSNGTAAHAEGIFTLAEGGGSHAEGYFSHARGTYAHSEGALTSAWGLFGSHAEGFNTRAAGDHSHAEGISTVATGSASHTEGNATSASNLFSHAEGRLTLASGAYAHAEGDASTSSGVASHAEGYFTVASQTGAHAEGNNSKALNVGSHAEGAETVASGQNSHAEGAYTTARGGQSHAQGLYNSASGTNSFAAGRNSIAYGETSFVMGTESNAINRHSIALGFLANAAHQESLVYSNYCNYYGSSSFADNTFNVFASGGAFILDPTTIGDPASAVKLIVDGSGLVGVNTPSPGEQLTVYGNISSNGTLSAGGPGFNFIQGNLGVGHRVPVEKLSISGNLSASGTLSAIGAGYNFLQGSLGIGSNNAAPNNAKLTINGSTSALGTLTATSENYFPLVTTANRNVSASTSDTNFNLIQGKLGINTYPLTSYGLHIRGGNIRVDGADWSSVAGFDGTIYDSDGQSLFDLRSARVGANYSLSIAESGLGYFMKFFGGRTGDTNPFISVKNNTPIRFAQFNSFYGTGFVENARIGSTGNLVVGIANDGTEKLTVAGNISASGTLSASGTGYNYFAGNVGINTFAPGEKLTVSGNISANGSLSASGTSSNYFAGKVGIGTNTPEQALHVLKASAGTVTAETNSIAVFEGGGSNHISILTPDSQTGGVVFGSPADNFGSYLSWNYDNNALKLATDKAGGFIQLLTGDEAEAVRITSSGNVGIGTTAPAEARLTVNGNISANGTLSASGTGNNYFAGNVSIGTDTPTANANLTIVKSTAGGGGAVSIVAGNASGDAASINFGYAGNTNRGQIRYLNGSTDAMSFYTSSNEMMRIRAGGQVGIGTTNPAERLTVNGNVSALSAVYTMGMQPIGFIPFVAKTTGFNLLGALNTNATVYTVPGGMRAMATGLHIVITNAVGTYTAGTMPSITLYAGSVSGPNQMIGLLALDTTPNYTAGRTSGTNSIGGNRNTTTSTIIVNIDTAAAGTSYTTLEATVYAFGYLIS